MTDTDHALEAITVAAERLVPELTERLRRHGLGEIEVAHGDLRLRVAATPGPPAPAAAAAAETPAAPPEPAATAPAEAASTVGVASPAVGFFVYAEGLGPGLEVTKGDELGHVEMLGVRHDVRAPRGGTVRHLVAESGEAVEYGQVVLELETAEAGAMTLALLFSPQGSQSVGMGRELAERSPAAAAAFAEADATLGWSVSDACWSGPAERLDDTRQTQPCLLTTSVAAFRALAEAADPAPAFVAGHSVGEYAALVAAGVLELPAALRLVARRGELMAGAGEGGMAAVLGLERETVQAVVDGVARPTQLVVANDNAPGQVVVSGTLDALEEVDGPMKAAGARRVLRLPVSGAFHSPLMAEVSERLAEAFEGETWRDARVTMISNVSAEPLTDASRIRTLLAEQVRSPVEWVACVRRMVDDGVEVMIECGAGAALVGMVKRIAPDVTTATVTDAASLDAAIELVGQRVTA